MMPISRLRAWLYASLLLNVVVLLSAYRTAGHREWLVRSNADSAAAAGAVELPGERVCSMCSAAPELCERLGTDFIAQTQAYSGTNARLRRALAKMRRGDPLTVGVIGGSVSKGHGIRDNTDPRYSHKNMHRVIFNHLNEMFPSASDEVVLGASGKHEGKNALANSAQGGVGTDYWSMCFGEHVPDDADIVIIELAINDELLMRNLDSYELLVRALLDLPSKPAVINIQTVALIFPTMAIGGDLHLSLAQFYDLPVISLRNPILPRILANASLIAEWFLPDGAIDPNTIDGYDIRHISNYGHRTAGELVNAYIDTQLCAMDAIEATADSLDIDKLYPIEPLPRMRLMQKYDRTTVVPKIKPNCFSTNAEKSPLVPAKSDGWREWNWQEKKYWIADVPGSQIDINFSTAIGIVQLFYQRSAVYGFGSVACWVDDERNRAVRVDGYWELPYNIGRSEDIRTDLMPGDHVLHCELLGSTLDPTGAKEFRIISVMSI